MDTQVADTLLGTLIDGRYRILGRVARGGMATVYTATDERLGRTVAIKMIHPTQARDPRFVDRFIEEAKTIARLTHPNVVAVYDQGTHAGIPYLVMEYVRGRTLREILAERRRLSPGEALAIMEQMLAAVAAAHRAGLVHRDVKPENVLVAEAPSGGTANLVDAVVKVADFGLARAVEASSDDTAGGHLMATVAYVAPELVTDGHADARTDVYSAGIVLFEMLTGRVPYTGGKPVEVAWQHVDRDVPGPSTYVPGLPSVLDELVGRATRRDPGARPTDAGALLAEVQAARDDLGALNTATTLLRQVAAPTMVVAPVRPAQRPPWARLPEARPAPRRRTVSPGPSWRDRMHGLRRRVAAHPHGRTGLVAACLAVALLVVAGAWWFGVGRYTVAPQFVSLPKAQAVQKAQAAGFTLKFDDGRYDEKVAKDTVLGQRPAASARIVKGGTITLTLSLGAERYKVPDIVGKTYELALVDLQQRKLTPDRKDRYDDNMPAGNVLTVEPAVNTEVAPGTKVVVWVSRGKAPLTVPNVVGRHVDEARTVLQSMGLLVTVEEKDSTKPKGQILEQSPPDGAGVEPGATIKLVVSKGPAQVAVPDVTSAHLPCAQAAQAIQGVGLTPKPTGNPAGVVMAQQPAPGTPVDPGSDVIIYCV